MLNEMTSKVEKEETHHHHQQADDEERKIEMKWKAQKNGNWNWHLMVMSILFDTYPFDTMQWQQFSSCLNLEAFDGRKNDAHLQLRSKQVTTRVKQKEKRRKRMKKREYKCLMQTYFILYSIESQSKTLSKWIESKGHGSAMWNSFEFSTLNL